MMDYLINRVFTKSNLDSILYKGTSKINSEVIEKCGLRKKPITQEEAFVEIYNYMKKKYRNEYFYKNQILNKILIGKHSLNTTSAIKELQIGNSIADFLVINGEAQVFEIKSGLDNLQRLYGQVNDYYKAFKYVNVIMDEKHLSAVKHLLPYENVGLYILTKRNTIRKIRKAIEKKDSLNHTVIFQILRKKEYESILKEYYGKVPQVADYYYYEACLDWFKTIPIDVVQHQLSATLKLRYINRYNKNNSLILDFPPALREVVYFSDYTSKKIKKLKSCLMKTF